jgi:tetratricopeptide (TPR) repeat protein
MRPERLPLLAAACLALTLTLGARNTLAAVLEGGGDPLDDLAPIEFRFDAPLQEDLPFLVIEALADLRDNPTNANYWVRLGDIYFLSEEPGKAATAFWRGARLQPDHPKALDNLGLSLIQIGDFETATALFTRLRTTRPGDTSILLNLGAARHGARDFATAEALFRRVLEQEPENDKALYNLAVIHADTGRAPEAITLFERAFTSNPNSPIPLFAAARMHARLDQPDLMFERLQQARPLVADDQIAVFLAHPAFAPWAAEEPFNALLKPLEQQE